VYPPKYEWFGVGWEAWGALAWDTNQRTVIENVSRYLDLGFPLRWMVIGSGFWPRNDPRYHATTSFGLWDPQLYTDPKGLIDRFHQRGLKVILGLRIAFIPDGPFAQEGVRRDVFLTGQGKPALFTIGFPRVPAYLLDAFVRARSDGTSGSVRNGSTSASTGSKKTCTASASMICATTGSIR
jgi:alpha-glucosidase (family GH31 glycosyl hydrolase)